jgi:ABC-type xylose transport system permease subunit
MYTLNYGLQDVTRQQMRFWAKVVCVLVGALIGAALGLYVAVRTIPLSPPVQYYYLGGHQ